MSAMRRIAVDIWRGYENGWYVIREHSGVVLWIMFVVFVELWLWRW